MDSITMTAEQQLPEGWEYVPFNMFFNVVSISDKKISQKEYLDNGKYPVIDQGNLFIGGYSNDESLILKISSPVIVFGDHTKCFKYVSFPFVAGADGIKVLEPQNGIYPKYAYYYCLSIDLTDRGYSRHFAFLKKCQFLIVPIETQQAIVNKIESLFDEIDEGIGRLKTAAQQIQQYRQSLLKNAFNGELTKEWRSKHADTLPSENELLAQIQTTREQHHAQQLADWQTTVSQWEQNGKEGKKPSKPKALTQAVKFEENSENRNKNSYIRIPIGFFIETPKYGTSKKCEYEKYENSTGVIRIPNITENGLINLEDMKYAEFSTEDKTDYALKKGDLLLIRSNGSVNIVGSVGLVGLEETNYIYAGYLIRLRPIQDIVNSRFLKFAFQSLDVRTQIEFKAKSTSGVNNINAQEVQDLQVNVFSLPEQTQIVAILEGKLTACDQLAAELSKQLKKAELLKQAVLKAAFSGNLLDK